jgi:hypothetical protein
MLHLCRRHSGVEFDEQLARFDLVSVLDVNGAHDAGLERLNELGAAVKWSLA